MTTTARVFKYIGFGILGVGAVFLFIWIVMLLWNALVPELFSGPALSYWQAAGILILSKILFGGLGGGDRDKSSKKKSKWRSKYHDKYKHGCHEEEVKVEKAEKADPEPQAE